MPSITVIEKKAKQGDANSQYLLGFLYDQGEQIPKDLSNALIWYKKAAAQGHAKAQFSLGRLYDLGEGIAEDNQEALKWYRKAAQQGDVSAQFSRPPGRVMSMLSSCLRECILKARACNRIMSKPIPGSTYRPQAEIRWPQIIKIRSEES
jgi:TPR repeat protein